MRIAVDGDAMRRPGQNAHARSMKAEVAMREELAQRTEEINYQGI
jgi:hypothetical protein